MKKILFGFIFVLAFVVMGFNILMGNRHLPFINNDNMFRESFNSDINMKLARKIAVKTDAKKVAVVGNGDCIMVGIYLGTSVGNRNKIKVETEKMIGLEYEDAKIFVEIESEKTQKIFDLTEKAEKGTPDNMLYSEFKELQIN